MRAVIGLTIGRLSWIECWLALWADFGWEVAEEPRKLAFEVSFRRSSPKRIVEDPCVNGPRFEMRLDMIYLSKPYQI